MIASRCMEGHLLWFITESLNLMKEATPLKSDYPPPHMLINKAEAPIRMQPSLLQCYFIKSFNPCCIHKPMQDM